MFLGDAEPSYISSWWGQTSVILKPATKRVQNNKFYFLHCKIDHVSWKRTARSSKAGGCICSTPQFLSAVWRATSGKNDTEQEQLEMKWLAMAVKTITLKKLTSYYLTTFSFASHRFLCSLTYFSFSVPMDLSHFPSHSRFGWLSYYSLQR